MAVRVVGGGDQQIDRRRADGRVGWRTELSATTAEEAKSMSS